MAVHVECRWLRRRAK